MRCPSCGHEIRDAEALFCPRCGTKLGATEATVTDRITPAPAADSGPASADTATSPEGDRRDDSSAQGRMDGAAALASDMAVALRRSLVSGGWVDAAQVAGFGLLAMLAVGAVFAAVIKLSDPTFGSGESALWVLEWVVILGALSIGVPVEGDLSISVLPMGSLLVIGWAIAWAARRVAAQSSADTLGARMIEGAKAGAPLALLSLLMALVFRIDGAAAAPGAALLLGGLWGALFGAIGGARAHGSISQVAGYLLETIAGRSRSLADGLVAGAIMLATSAVIGAAATLVALIMWLALGDVSLEAGEAVLIVFTLLAFAPNIVAGVVGFGLGAPVMFGGDFGFGGGGEFSLLGWGADAPAPYLYLALLIPAVSCLFGGYVARRRARPGADVNATIGVAAIVYALALTVIVSLGNLDLGRSVTGATEFELGPDPAGVFVLGLAWAAAVGYIGWKLGESSADEPARPTTGDR
jgi:zinc-ribbon domain